MLLYHSVVCIFNQHTKNVSKYYTKTPFKTKLTSNNTIHRNINRSRVARRITQQIHIGATQFLHLSKTRESTVVFQLLLPIRLLRHPVGHSRVDQTRGDTVDSNTILGPLHGKRMGHVSDASLRRAVGGGWHALGSQQNSMPSKWSDERNKMDHSKREIFTHLVRAVGCHRRRENNRPLDTELDECARGTPGRVECAKQLIRSCQSQRVTKKQISRLPTLTEKSASISSVVKSSAALWFVRPAFTTIPCSAPASSIILSTAAEMLASWVTSALTAKSWLGKRVDRALKSLPVSLMSME